MFDGFVVAAIEVEGVELLVGVGMMEVEEVELGELVGDGISVEVTGTDAEVDEVRVGEGIVEVEAVGLLDGEFDGVRVVTIEVEGVELMVGVGVLESEELGMRELVGDELLVDDGELDGDAGI